MNDKVSIITINYNNKTGLQKTINSVFEQSSTNFEFIVVDGNSTDGSKELLALHSDQFTKWVSEPDSGIYNAMNKGISLSTGDYLLFLNSGDYLAGKDVIEKVIGMIDGSYGIYYGDIIFEELKQKKKVVFPEQLTFNFFFAANLSHQASFIKRKLFDELFYYNEKFKIASDWEFFIYAICKQNVPYKHLPLLTTIYDGTGLSSNAVNYEVMYQERRISLQKYFPAFVEDYTQISQFQDRRVKQLLFIKKHSVAWKVLKALIKGILLFLPKMTVPEEEDKN
ncbi:glycosyltransferase family 2 protein [Pedobacter sp. L105]|uniref:glycosyltransferase family 2 protein n=1 Tax=Pedobacter sp. L105 TaxID=1641871 RepID=UPI00131CB0C9|nr:glycosyltransferase family 2 protein [Pedobacter sp. L105]